MSSFPRQEYMESIVGDAEYVEDAAWRLFEDLDGDLPPGRNVLLQLHDRYTILSAEEFKRMAWRILGQL